MRGGRLVRQRGSGLWLPDEREVAAYGRPRKDEQGYWVSPDGRRVPPIAGGAGYSLVGTVGAVAVPATGAAATPAWGTSETRSAGNLLVCWVKGANLATLPATPSGWSLAGQIGTGTVNGSSGSASIFFRIAAGGDAAPTIAGIASVQLYAQLAEFSGNTATPLDQHPTLGVGSSPSSPQVVTAAATDATAGQLVVYCLTAQFSSATGLPTCTATLNNGVVQHDTTDSGSANSNDMYLFGWGVTTSNASPDSASFAWNPGSGVAASTVDLVLASFKSPVVPGNFFPLM